ncbi:uncharacterized protein LOC113951063 isoform X2 [Corapipo altera]|uniref:uncharacterized protein LOC113951063 isoform X2 n=1 Tax=Corapipo altera TaxID=415028 RepID=UPI000FD6B2FF|nr:uncharacterized protein LOC113951063 isoform X2 [Corapipo altera]
MAHEERPGRPSAPLPPLSPGGHRRQLLPPPGRPSFCLPRLGPHLQCFYDPVRAESSARTATGVLLEEKQDQAQLKAFFQSKGKGSCGRDLLHHSLAATYCLPLQGRAMERSPGKRRRQSFLVFSHRQGYSKWFPLASFWDPVPGQKGLVENNKLHSCQPRPIPLLITVWC